MAEQTMQTLGRYTIRAELGRGGFATVYRALDTTLEREVALKILHPQLLADRSFAQRFRKEARAMAGMRHPNIITVYEVGEADGRLFIAMELAQGPGLAQAIADRGRLPWSETLAILKPVCDALDYAHAQGIVHRDLKPANILLDKDRGALLTDFGFARLMSESSVSMSLSGGILGTPAYIAPEVWELEAAKPSADIYALGCIVYEMLSGQALFVGKTPMQVMRAHDQGPQFQPTSAWTEGVPAGVEPILRRALARQPSARFPSASAMWHALNDLEAEAQTDREKTDQIAIAAQWKTEAQAARTEIERREAETRAKPARPALRSLPTPKRHIPIWIWLGSGVILLACAAGIAVILASITFPPRTPTPFPAPTQVSAEGLGPTQAPQPTKMPSPATTRAPVCTPPACKSGEVYSCPGNCPGGCGTTCATVTPSTSSASLCGRLPNALTVAAGQLGSPDNPIVIVFVPIGDVGLIRKGGIAMVDCLGKMTGLTYKVEAGTSEAASIEVMGGGKAQMGFLNTFSILLAKQKYDVDVALIAQRKYGFRKADGTYATFDFDPDKAMAGQLASFYKPEYFAKAGSGIKTLQDVKGKSFCFVDPRSITGGIVPRIVFKSLGIDPDKDLKSIYAGSHDKAAIAVYQGDCDAGVAFMDILTDKSTNLAGKFPDIAQKVQVFAVGDRIPNEGLQFIKNLDPAIRSITVDALLAMEADPSGNAIVKSIYNYENLEKADFTKYYAPFADTLKKAGVDVVTLVRQ